MATMRSGLPFAASAEALLVLDLGECKLTYSPLDVAGAIKLAGNNHGFGAICTFVGQTRNSFAGKVVTHLEYQAYSELAIKTMAEIVRRSYAASVSEGKPGVSVTPTEDPPMYCVLHHRLGPVPVGEPSIIVAVSSPHRKQAIAACEMILERVKQTAQIWKLEFYEDEPPEVAQWKAN